MIGEQIHKGLEANRHCAKMVDVQEARSMQPTENMSVSQGTQPGTDLSLRIPVRASIPQASGRNNMGGDLGAKGWIVN